MNTPAQVPLIERLRSVPKTASEWIRSGLGQRNVPYGAMLHEAADEIKRMGDWIERLQKTTQTLTCVYCGKEYPPGSPAHGSSVLTEHIKVCEKHPMRECEKQITELRSAVLPLMILKSQHCDGQIGWRGQPDAIAGQIRVRDILKAEAALSGTTISEDAKNYVEHKWHEDRNAGVINRPQGPCGCESCAKIRSLLNS